MGRYGHAVNQPSKIQYTGLLLREKYLKTEWLKKCIGPIKVNASIFFGPFICIFVYVADVCIPFFQRSNKKPQILGRFHHKYFRFF